MSYNSLAGLTSIQAAGVAQRAALSLHSTRTQSSALDIDNEINIREGLIQEIRDAFGLGNDNQQSTLEKIVEILYEQSDSLLERLEVGIASNFTFDTSVNNYSLLQRRIQREYSIITKTISYPSQIFQEFLSQRGGIIRYEAIYVKHIEGINPYYEFVAGEKAGRNVHVNQALRFYPNQATKVTIPTNPINALLRSSKGTVTADALAALLKAYFPDSTIIIVYSSHWVFSYYQGGDTQPTRDLSKIDQAVLNGFRPMDIEPVAN